MLADRNVHGEILKRVCQELSRAPIRIASSNGRGFGLVATQDFAPGSVIFTESWLFAITDTIWDCGLQDESHHQQSMALRVENAVRNLSSLDRQLFESLPLRDCNQYESNYANLVSANNWKFERDGVVRLCVLPLSSMLNHSCSASACIVPNFTGNDCRLVAVRPIATNEEISVCYIPTIDVIMSDVQSRRLSLSQGSSWRFHCACVICDRNDCQSDSRRRSLSALYEKAQKEMTLFLQGIGEQSDSIDDLFRRKLSPLFRGCQWRVADTEMGCKLMSDEGLFHVECESSFILLAACSAYHSFESIASDHEALQWLERGLKLQSLVYGTDSLEASRWKSYMRNLFDDRRWEYQTNSTSNAFSHRGILYDYERNTAYSEALHKAGAPDSSLVLDLGSGTALLSMLACRALPNSSVIACEVNTDCAELAKRIVVSNELSDRIHVANQFSMDLQLAERADLCVFEIFDSRLLGEGVLPIMRDVHRRLLKPGASIIPEAAVVKAKLVECAPLAIANVPELRGSPWPLMVSQFDSTVFTALSSVWDALDISFASPPASTSHAKTASVQIHTSGTLQAVIWWWELKMGGGQVLTNWSAREETNSERPARHHWSPCVSFIDPLGVTSGDELRVVAAHDDEAVWFSLGSGHAEIPSRWCETGNSPEAEIPTLQREHYIIQQTWANLLRRQLHAMISDLSISDGKVLLSPNGVGLISSMAHACHDSGHQPIVLLREGASSFTVGTQSVSDDILFVSLDDDDVLCVMLGSINILFLDPLFEGVGDSSPWSLVNWCRRQLREVKMLLAPSSEFFPNKAIFYACAVECSSLWLSWQPFSSICGLDMSLVNTTFCTNSSNPVFCHLCEYAWRPLSSAVDILSIPLIAEEDEVVILGTSSLRITSTGTCHAVVVWVEFPSGGNPLSTGPPAPGKAPTGFAQEVHLLEEAAGLVAGESAVNIDVSLPLDTDAMIVINVHGSCKRRRTHS